MNIQSFLRALCKYAHTFETVFPLKWAPWHHFCLWKVMKTWTKTFQSNRKLWTVLSFVFFWKDCCHVVISSVFLPTRCCCFEEWERVYLRKWSGLARYAVISVCQRHSSSLLCLWNQSQAVHYPLSSTKQSTKAYLLSFEF